MSIRDTTDWNRLDATFSGALDLPEAERRSWLQAECLDAPDIVDKVIQLLAADAASAWLFESLAHQRDQVLANAAVRLEAGTDDPRIGRRYGDWRILKRIGSGGFSVVYEAKRDDGRYDQMVALKVLQGGTSNGDSVRHFLRERRILSTLDHPGLVRILDGGETATGAPWLVMDLVPGRQIVQYSNEVGLDLNSRLSLLAKIADAVQSAHSKLIVHRDIKPDNIIVSNDGHARLLDFGISSLVGATQDAPNVIAMTPEFASPEQLRLEEATTASDIYQLGRVLEILCEPFVISSAVEAIISKATADAQADRYTTAATFAVDLRRVVEGDAPVARPDTRTEALFRVVRRNRAAAALAIGLILGLVGWGLSATLYAGEIARQRSIAFAQAERADRGKTVLLALFRRLDPFERDGVSADLLGSTSFLEPALEDVRSQLSDDPELQAELVGWMARAHQHADDLKEAYTLAEEAVNLLERSGDNSSSAYASAVALRGMLDIDLENAADGNAAIERALQIARIAPQADSSALDVFLIAAWSSQDDWSRQHELFKEALPRAMAADSINAQIEIHAGLGRSFRRLGLLTEAERHARQALDLAQAVYGAAHPRLTLPLSILGAVLADQGRFEEAIETHSRARAISTVAFGEGSDHTLSLTNNLALAELSAGNFENAIALFESVLASRIAISGENALAVGEVLQNKAVAQAGAGQLDEAIDSLTRAEEIFRSKLPQTNPQRAFPALTRAGIYLEQSRFLKAEDSAREALMALSQALPAGHYAIEIARCRVGMARLGLKDLEGARANIEPALLALSNLPDVPAKYVDPCKAAGLELGLR